MQTYEIKMQRSLDESLRRMKGDAWVDAENEKIIDQRLEEMGLTRDTASIRRSNCAHYIVINISGNANG